MFFIYSSHPRSQLFKALHKIIILNFLKLNCLVSGGHYTLAQFYASLQQEQRKTVYAKLTPKQQKDLLTWYQITDPANAVLLINQGADITDMSTGTCAMFFETLTPEQRKIVYAKLTPAQQKEVDSMS